MPLSAEDEYLINKAKLKQAELQHKKDLEELHAKMSYWESVDTRDLEEAKKQQLIKKLNAGMFWGYLEDQI